MYDLVVISYLVVLNIVHLVVNVWRTSIITHVNTYHLWGFQCAYRM